MAEAIGLALGIASLAGLYSNCVDAFNQIQSAKTFSRDYELSLVLFDVRKACFLQWGDGVGLLSSDKADQDPLLHRADIQALVERVLLNVNMILTDAESLKSKYKANVLDADVEAVFSTAIMSGVSSNRLQSFKTAYARFQARLKTSQKQTPLFRKAQWAIGGQAEFAKLNADLNDLIDGLYKLIPIPQRFAQMMVKEDIASCANDITTLKSVKEVFEVGGATVYADIWADAASLQIELSEASALEHRTINAWRLGVVGAEYVGSTAERTDGAASALESSSSGSEDEDFASTLIPAAGRQSSQSFPIRPLTKTDIDVWKSFHQQAAQQERAESESVQRELAPRREIEVGTRGRSGPQDTFNETWRQVQPEDKTGQFPISRNTQSSLIAPYRFIDVVGSSAGLDTNTKQANRPSERAIVPELPVEIKGQVASKAISNPETGQESDKWFSQYLKKTHDLLYSTRGHEYVPFVETRKVRIAILSTGISTPEYPHSNFRDHVMECRSFIPGQDSCEDEDGLGSFSAALLATVAPNAKIFAARVFVASAAPDTAGAKAIQYAIEEWNVDIIAMSSSFTCWSPTLDCAFRLAESRGVLLFGPSRFNELYERLSFSERVKFPQVFTIYSTDWLGNQAGSSPARISWRLDFSTLGEDVPCEWYVKGSKRLSGCEVATVVATGFAALVLEFIRQMEKEQLLSKKQASFASSKYYMSRLFGSMSTRNSSNVHVVPWTLLNIEIGHDLQEARSVTAARIAGILGPDEF